MSESYREALDWVLHQGRFGHLGLGRMETLLERLGHPEEAFRVVHIGGTNGKGSTSAFVDAVLREAGERVGLYTSPHLFDWRERIQVDGAWIQEEAFTEAVAEVRDVLGSGPDSPTTFEALTAAALVHFRREGVTTAVVEVGLGGRLDATNVIRRPVASAIVSVGMDHMDRLGATLEAIAFEKAGIAKPGVPLVTGSLPSEAATVVARRAREVGAPLYRIGEEIGLKAGGGGYEISSRGRTLHLSTALPGRHQGVNAAVAATLALVVRPDLTESQIARSIRQTHLEGRCEILQKAPPIVVDAAKNPMGTAALMETLDDLYPGRPIHLVFGCLAERDPRELLRPLAGRVHRTLIRALDDERALPPADLLKAAGDMGLAPSLALSEEEELAFLQDVPREAVGVVTGSFYLVGPFLKAWARRGAEGRVTSR